MLRQTTDASLNQLFLGMPDLRRSHSAPAAIAVPALSSTWLRTDSFCVNHQNSPTSGHNEEIQPSAGLPTGEPLSPEQVLLPPPRHSISASSVTSLSFQTDASQEGPDLDIPVTKPNHLKPFFLGGLLILGSLCTAGAGAYSAASLNKLKSSGASIWPIYIPGAVLFMVSSCLLQGLGLYQILSALKSPPRMQAEHGLPV